MVSTLSTDTQAILLLTAPLIAGGNNRSKDLLTLNEYKKLARFLLSIQCQPSDLLGDNSDSLISECDKLVHADRLKRLLERGFMLGQAVERWFSRSLWVVSRADADYPKRLKKHLKDDAPAILYGSGNLALLNRGGLAVVGSRHVDDSIIAYADNVGRKAAGANRQIVSGGAKGVDLAAMRGALNSQGDAVGILAERLERASLDRENRQYLMEGRLVLASPYDPQASFNVGHAMQRNKLIYALSDAALVVNADYKRGGTWAGAIEQLEKFHMVKVFVRSTGTENKALTALHMHGASYWPNPETSEEFEQLCANCVNAVKHSASRQAKLFPSENWDRSCRDVSDLTADWTENSMPAIESLPAAVQLFATVRQLVLQIEGSMSENEFAQYLGVSNQQAREWLVRLLREKVLTMTNKPKRYSLSIQRPLLS